jgi:hypothetical protein
MTSGGPVMNAKNVIVGDAGVGNDVCRPGNDLGIFLLRQSMLFASDKNRDFSGGGPFLTLPEAPRCDSERTVIFKQQVCTVSVSSPYHYKFSSDVTGCTLPGITDGDWHNRDYGSVWRLWLTYKQPTNFYFYPSALILPHLSLDGANAVLCGIGLFVSRDSCFCSVSQLAHIQHDDPFGLITAGFHFIELPLHNIRLSNENESGNGSHREYASGQPNHQSRIKLKVGKFFHASVVFGLICIVYFAIARIIFYFCRHARI